MAYKITRVETIDIVYETEIYVEAGDRLESLIAPFYDRCTNGILWEDYKWEHRELNKELFKNGRALQVYDTVRVQWYVRKKLIKNEV